MFDLLRQRNFALIWFAGLVSTAGDFAFVIALPIHVFTLTHSTLATAGAFGVSVLPGIVIGSIAGVFVDRWDRKRTMIWADVSRAAILLALLIPGASASLWVVYPVAAMLGSIGHFFAPAESAMLPRLVLEDQLVRANALNSLSENLGRLAGPALGASLYAAVSLGGVALVDAISFAASASCIALVTVNGRPLLTKAVESGASVFKHMASDWRDGIALVRNDRGLTALVTANIFGGISEGIFLTLALAPLVLTVLGGTKAQVGWITSAQAIGGLIGGVIVAKLAHRFEPRWLLVGGMIGLGCADLGFFNANRIAHAQGAAAVFVAMGFMAFAGFPSVALGAGRTSLLQLWTEDAFRGRVFGANRAVFGLAVLIGLGFAGLLGDRIGIVPVLIMGSGAWIAGGLAMLAMLPRSDANSVREPNLA